MMGDLRRDELLGHHTDDLSAPGQHRVGDDAHEPDVTTAVHESVTARRERRTQPAGGARVLGRRPRTRSTEHTHRRHRHIVPVPV